MEESMPEARTWHPIPRYPPYVEMVQEALDSSSSYCPSGDLPSISYECILSYILSKYPLLGKLHQLDHDILLRGAIMKLSREGIVYCERSGRYVILPQFSSISAASFRPPPPKYYQPPPSSPPQQHMEEDTAEERGLALVPFDIKHYILLPNSPNSKIPCDPPPHYPPPLWLLGS